MAFSEKLANRVRELIAATETNVAELRMFSGLCFLVNDKMCIGVQQDKIMVRLNPDVYETVMEHEGCTAMDFTGRVMKGYVFVNEAVLTTNKKLSYWLSLALEYNKIAKPSKKKKKA